MNTRALWSAPLLLAASLAACGDDNDAVPGNGDGTSSSSGASSSSGGSGASSGSSGATSSSSGSGESDAGESSVQLSLSSSALELAPGSTLSVDVAITAASPVDLSVTNLPPGVTGTFSAITADRSSVLTLTAALDAAPSALPLLVWATGAEGTATAQATLTVLAPSSDFSLFAVPSSLVLYQGQSAPLQLNVARRGAFAGDVVVSFDGLPAGVSIEPATLTIPSGATGGAVTLTVTQAAVPSTSATLTLRGAGGGGAEGTFALQIPARSGTLDTTFGVGGAVISPARFTPPMFGGDLRYSRTADRKLVVCGSSGNTSLGVARILEDGTLDPTFNNGAGTRTLPGGGGFGDRAIGCGVLPDGKLLIVAQVQNAATLIRLTSAGETDLSYGTNGTVSLGTGISASAMVLQADGKVVLGGSTQVNGNYVEAVVRLEASGAFDQSFGASGIAQLSSGGQRRSVTGLSLQGSNILAFGIASSTISRGSVSRLTPTGVPDPSFAGDGFLELDERTIQQVTALAVLPDNKLVIAGVTGSPRSTSVARLLATGDLDPAFGTAGVRQLGYEAQTMSSILPLPDGSIAVAGTGNPAPGQTQSYLARLTSAGALDVTFNGTGALLATPSAALASSASAVYRLDDGKLLLAGSVDNGSRATLMRVWP